MTTLDDFLDASRSRIERRSALTWAGRGAAAAAVLAMIAQLAARRWPPSPAWGPVASALALGALTAATGWVLARPTPFTVARTADLRLAGKDRLTTALELAGVEGGLAERQRADALEWARTVTPRRVTGRDWPRMETALAVVALAVAVALAVVDNPAVGRRERERDFKQARERAANEVAAIAQQVGAAASDRDPDLQAALVRELATAEQALLAAPTPTRAAAALSRAQESLRSVAAAGMPGSHDAVAEAGAQLAAHPASAQAGAALAKAAPSGGGSAAQMNAALQALGAHQQAALAEQLRQTAADRPGPAADSLRRAADALQSGRLEQAGASLAAAAGGPERAAAELEAMGASLGTLTPSERTSLADVLQRAADAARDDPRLAEPLSRAGDRLKAADLTASADAVKAAGQAARDAGARRRSAADAATASNALQAVKQGLLAPPSDTAAKCPTAQAVPAPPPAAKSSTSTSHAPAAADCGSQGASQGQGAGDEGKGPGESDGQGKGGGEGSGSGSGEGRGGGGSTGGGASGGLGGAPGSASDKVYVPGIFGPGQVQTVAGGGTGGGADSALQAFETVYAEYRAAALRQVDRELVPDQIRELLLRYFGGAR